MHRNIQPSPSPQLLTTIARHMEALARAAPWKPGMPLKPYRRTLTGGLTLTYFFDARLSKWNLWLSRIRTHPSIVELNLVRRAFEVPTGHQVAQAHNEDDDSYSTYLTWVEYAQAHKIKVIA